MDGKYRLYFHKTTVIHHHATVIVAADSREEADRLGLACLGNTVWRLRFRPGEDDENSTNVEYLGCKPASEPL